MKPLYCIAQPAEIQLILKKSRFIGQAYPVDTPEQAARVLESVRKQYWDASHNCYAYIVGEAAGQQKFSDDGEPQGTAGMPMLEVLKAQALTNVLVVITRYFGGIQLGAGGLVRAYSRATAMAVEAAGRMEYAVGTLCYLEVDYALWGKVERLLHETPCKIVDTQFAQSIAVKAWIKDSAVPGFEAALTEATGARVQPDWRGSDRIAWEL